MSTQIRTLPLPEPIFQMPALGPSGLSTDIPGPPPQPKVSPQLQAILGIQDPQSDTVQDFYKAAILRQPEMLQKIANLPIEHPIKRGILSALLSGVGGIGNVLSRVAGAPQGPPGSYYGQQYFFKPRLEAQGQYNTALGALGKAAQLETAAGKEQREKQSEENLAEQRRAEAGYYDVRAQAEKAAMNAPRIPPSLNKEQALAVEDLMKSKGMSRVDAIQQIQKQVRAQAGGSTRAGTLNPIIAAQIGEPPDPKNYSAGTQDPKYIADRTAWGKQAEAITNRMVQVSSAARGTGFYGARPYTVIDAATGQVTTASGTEITENPGKYLMASPSTVPQAMGKQALINDIRGGIQTTKQAAEKLDKSFDAGSRALLAAGLADPTTTSMQFFQSIPRGSLTEAQEDYVIQLFQLREQAMAMRSVLGAGQGSEDLRRAILSTIPGPGTPSTSYALKQLDAFERVLGRLEKGVVTLPPGLNLQKAGSGQGQAAAQAATHRYNPETGKIEVIK